MNAAAPSAAVSIPPGGTPAATAANADAGGEAASPFGALLGLAPATLAGATRPVGDAGAPPAAGDESDAPEAAAQLPLLALPVLTPAAADPATPAAATAAAAPAAADAIAASADPAPLLAAIAARDVAAVAGAVLADGQDGPPPVGDVESPPGKAFPRDAQLIDVAKLVAAAHEAGNAPARAVAEPALPLPLIGAGSGGDAGSANAQAAGVLAPPPSAPPPSAAVAPPPVTVPPADPRWAEQIAASVAWSARRETTDVEIRLHPPELGPLRVQLKIDGHRIDAQFSAPQVATRDALEATLPRLRELLHAQGLSLMQAQVSDQRRDAPAPFAPAVAPVEAVHDDALEPVVLRLRHLGLLDEYA